MDKILGIKIDNLKKKEILEKIESFLSNEHFYQIATINPEFILEAQKNKEFKNILNNCDLNIADGMGVKLAFWRHGKSLKCRMTGIDLMLKILEIANKKQLGIFLIANKNGLSTWEETAEAIKTKFPNINIEGENINCHSCESRNPVSNSKVSTLDSRLRGNDRDLIIFCNFGAPYQEIFLNSLKNDTIGLAMGVGGSFDFLTEKIKRAPRWMCQLGLEWFWRLLLQPQRWKRIFNAVVIFPIKIILNK